MRMICGLLLILCSFRAVSAQGRTDRLADSVDGSRTIIAKLDHAAQSDPPPNFEISILVKQHQDATNFMALADSVSTIIRHGGVVGGASMFQLYSQFTDLFDKYELFTIYEKRPLELDKVRDVTMAKEYAGIKGLFEIATTIEIERMEEQLRSCPPSQSSRK